MKRSLKNRSWMILLVWLLFAFKTERVEFYKKLSEYCSTLPAEFGRIDAERQKDLKEMGDYILEKRGMRKKAQLLFICTSNSRRSHLSQIWAYTASIYYGVDSVACFSGGTEATRVHANTVSVLKRCGFSVTTSQGGDNPVYFVSAGNDLGEWPVFSKKYSHSINPKAYFCAAMVCSEADRSCPSVDGAELRLGLAYDDPKYYDGTPAQDQKYDERCRQIATEMFFVMHYVKEKLILRSEAKKGK